MSKSFSIDRRLLLAGAAATLTVGAATTLQARKVPVVTVLGDSITAGYGLKVRAETLPVQLEAELKRQGVAARVVGAGVSGDTTAAGLRRLDRDVPADTDVCVVALGANDLLNGVDPARVKANLDAIVRRLQARGVRVVVAGMRAPPLLDPAYVKAFDAAFPSVARAHGAALYPFLLDGVALDPRLNQADRLHPNGQGVAVIARRLAPVVARTVQRKA
jgi:acyl-CoA thioesterase-1